MSEEKTSKTASTIETVQKPKNPSARVPAYLALIMSSLSLAIVANLFLDQLRMSKKPSTATIEAKMHALHQGQQSQKAELETLQQQALHLEQDLDKRVLASHKGIQGKLQQTHALLEAALLDRVAYSLELAAIHAKLDPDKTLSLALLAQCQKLLSANSDPKLGSIKQQLAAAIQTLQQNNTIGKDQAMSALNDLQANLSQLPFKSIEAAVTKPSESQAGQSRSKKLWTYLRGEFSQLVKVRHQDSLQAAIPVSEQQIVQRAEAAFILRESSWALLTGDVKLYQHSFKQLQQLLQTEFELHSPAGENILKQLQILENTKLGAEAVDLHALHQAFLSYRTPAEPAVLEQGAQTE